MVAVVGSVPSPVLVPAPSARTPARTPAAVAARASPPRLLSPLRRRGVDRSSNNNNNHQLPVPAQRSLPWPRCLLRRPRLPYPRLGPPRARIRHGEALRASRRLLRPLPLLPFRLALSPPPATRAAPVLVRAPRTRRPRVALVHCCPRTPSTSTTSISSISTSSISTSITRVTTLTPTNTRSNHFPSPMEEEGVDRGPAGAATMEDTLAIATVA